MTAEIIPADAPIPLRRHDVWEDRAGPSPVQRLLAEWLVGYSSADTRKNYGIDMRAWLEFCGRSDLDPLTVRRPHVEAWLRTLEAAGYSPATRARRIGAVSAFYSWCAGHDYVVRNPCVGIKRPQYDPDLAKQGGLTMGQLVALLAAADTVRHPHSRRDAFAVNLMAYLGLRVGTVCAANHEDLGTYRGLRGITVTHKRGKRRFVPFNGPVARACDLHLEQAQRAPWIRAGIIVHRDQVGPPAKRPLFTLYETGERVTRSSIATALTRLAAEAGLPPEVADNITPHWLRHTFVTLSLEQGTQQRHVQDAAGHASGDTTRAYDQGRHSVEHHPTWLLQQSVEAARITDSVTG